MKRTGCLIVVATVVVSVAASVFAASEVHGRLNSDGCTGRSVTPHGWGEEIIYLSPLISNVTGGGGTTLTNPAGWYSIAGGFNAGDYLLSTLGFDGVPAFSASRITLPGGSVVVDPVYLTTPAHYSVMYNQNYTEWASEPWLWGSSFYQTFVATSHHITRLATKLAGKSGDHYWMVLNFGVYATNGGVPSTWPLISPIRSYYFAGGVDPIIVTAWAPFRSNEMNLTVGQTYALRMWAAPGSQATSFALVTRPDVNNGYAAGQLYAGDTPRPDLDAYAYVSGGDPSTVTNYAPVSSYDLITIANWSTRFGQTFQATGSGLAGVEIVYTTGQPDTVSLPISFQLYDQPNGTPIGPVRRTAGVHGYYQGRASAAWADGEAPLVTGQMYYLEWTPPLSGCNTWYLNEDMPGQAYLNGVAQPTHDLMMAIAEYDTNMPAIGLSTNELSYQVRYGNPAFTDSFTVRNSSVGTLNYTITEDGSWLDISPTIGTSTGETDTITVTITPAGVDVGIHSATITVTDPAASNSAQTIAVSLTIEPYPGDMDGDHDVDLEDWGLFQACMTAPGIPQTAPACASARLDDDQDVDADDVLRFVSCLSGSGVQPALNCGS